MNILDQLNKRVSAKKAEAITPLQHLGNSIYTQMLGTSDAAFKELAIKKDCCPLCGSDLSEFNPANVKKAEACPKCGAKGGAAKVKKPATKPTTKPSKDTDKDKKKEPDGDPDDMPKPAAKPAVAAEPDIKPVPKVDPVQTPQVQAPAAPTGQRGGFLYEGDTPTPAAASASDMVQNIGSALGHRVEVNSDAPGMGVSHAGMMVHPEWNQDGIKSKIKGHLEGKGWKTTTQRKETTVHTSPDGHKVHVAQVGGHLIVSSEDKEGTVPKALRQAPVELDAKGRPIKKDVQVQKGGVGSGRHGGVHPDLQAAYDKAGIKHDGSGNFNGNVTQPQVRDFHQALSANGAKFDEDSSEQGSGEAFYDHPSFNVATTHNNGSASSDSTPRNFKVDVNNKGATSKQEEDVVPSLEELFKLGLADVAASLAKCS